MVRQATLADLDGMMAFQLAMARETEDWELDPTTLERGMLLTLRDPNKGTYWVAAHEKELFGMLLTQHEWSDWRCANVVWIQSVYVRPDMRQRGVFQSLYQHVWAWVQASDELSGVRLYVEKRNEVALSAYHAMGMRSDHYNLCEQMKFF